MAKNKVPEIQTKSLGQLTDEAVTANIQNLPRIAEAFAQFGPQFGEAAFNSFVASNPDIARVIPKLADLLGTRLDQAKTGQVPDFVLAPARERLRTAQSIRGNALSPISGASEAQLLGELAEESIQNTLSQARGFTGQRQGGEAPSLADLGLDLPGVGDQVERGVELMDFEQTAAIENFNNRLARRKAIGKLIGGGAGYLAGGPAGAAAGRAIGGEVGGTFF